MSSKVDVYVTETKQWDHIEPIWFALPEELRGEVHEHYVSDWRNLAPNVMCAGYDAASFVGGLGRKVIYVEHGAGQSYVGWQGGGNYVGGRGFRNVALFICPSESAVAAWKATYPKVPAVAVGCPKLDRWLGKPVPSPRNIGVTFHWPTIGNIPEMGSAWDHYESCWAAAKAAVEATGGSLIVTWHPKWDTLRPGYQEAFWTGLGVPVAYRLEEFYHTVGTLVADNTSAMYEMAALRRRVLALNAPWYRKNVHHGMRFWKTPFWQADGPLTLIEYLKTPQILPLTPVTPEVYAYTDGSSTQRAMSAILEVLGV